MTNQSHLLPQYKLQAGPARWYSSSSHSSHHSTTVLLLWSFHLAFEWSRPTFFLLTSFQHADLAALDYLQTTSEHLWVNKTWLTPDRRQVDRREGNKTSKGTQRQKQKARQPSG